LIEIKSTRSDNKMAKVLKEEFLDISRVDPDQVFEFSAEPSVDNYIQMSAELTNMEDMIISAVISAAAGKYIYGNRKVIKDDRKLGPYRVNLKRERYNKKISGGVQFSVTKVNPVGVPFIDNPDGLYSTRDLAARAWTFVKKDPSTGKWVADSDTLEKVKALLDKFQELSARLTSVRAEFEARREFAAAEARRAATRERRQISQSAIERAKKIMNDMSDEDKEVIKNWALENVTRVEFSIPHGEIDFKGTAKETKRAEDITADLNRKRADFFDKYGLVENDYLDDMQSGTPVTIGDVTLKWRNAATTAEARVEYYNLWAVAGVMYLRSPLSAAPKQVITLVERAKRITLKQEDEEVAVKDADKEIHSSVFCHAVILGLFEGNLSFLNGSSTGTLTGIDDVPADAPADRDAETTIADAGDDYDAIASEAALSQDFPEVSDYDDEDDDI
jgi:hypothetical protein